MMHANSSKMYAFYLSHIVSLVDCLDIDIPQYVTKNVMKFVITFVETHIGKSSTNPIL